MQHELEERRFRELLKVNIGDLHDAKTMKALRQSRNDDRSMRDVDFMPCNFPGIQANADYSYAGQPEELASCKHMFLLRRNHVHRIFYDIDNSGRNRLSRRAGRRSARRKSKHELIRLKLLD